MSITIIVLLVIAIVVLLIIRAKQNQGSEPQKKTKTSSIAKTNNRNTKTPKAVSSKKESARATQSNKIQAENRSIEEKLDILIADKQYAKAEGLINLYLNENHNLHNLYAKLLTIYHLQNDDFAIRQLLDTVQRLNLNEVYQHLYTEHEKFKSRTISSKSEPSIVTPASTTTEITNNDLVIEQQPSQPEILQIDSNVNNTLEFDSISFDAKPAASKIQEEPSTESNTIEFEHKISNTPNNLEIAPSPIDTTTLAAQESSEQILEFKLEPTESTSPAETALDAQQNKITAEQPELELETALDEPNTSESETNSFASTQDPIVQAFPVLAELNPVDLDIELAEQYIRLGNKDAAKQLLTEQHVELSTEQSQKVSILLQKIA